MPLRFPVMVQFTGWREPISMSGAGKVVDGILRRRPCFFYLTHRRLLPPRATLEPWPARVFCCGPAGASAGLAEAVALAVPLGRLPLDFPEHPYNGRPQADHDAQKYQRQSRDG